MANVALFDGSAGASFAELDFAGKSAVYVGLQVYRSTAQETAETGFNTTACELDGSLGASDGLAVESDGTIDGFNDYTNPTALTADNWHTLEMFWQPSATPTKIAVDGVIGSDTSPTSVDTVVDVVIGHFGAAGLAHGGFYIAHVKIGTAAGLGDILDEDWTSGDFSNWTSTSGTVSIVAAPTTPPAFSSAFLTTVPEGFSLAFDDGPLTDLVTWSRVDSPGSVDMESISIRRGRPTERDKTAPGTVTITGIDQAGVLDPTNTGGAHYGSLDPVKQAAVSLYNPLAGTWSYLFRGYVDTYAFTLAQREAWLEFEVTLTDMLDFLNDAEITPDEAGNAAPGGSLGDCFYTGQHVDDRLLAVLADAGTAFLGKIWPSTLLQIASGNVFVQGRVYANRTSLLQVIDEACDAELPGATNRFITSDGSFAFRGRYYRYVPSLYIPADNTNRVPGTEMLHWYVGDIPAFNSDNTLAVYNSLKFERSKEDLINNSLVSPVGISDADLASGSQFKTDATSTTDYGPRTAGMSLENLITDNADDGNNALQETASFAEAIVGNYKNPVTYVSELVFRNPSPADGDAAARWKLLCGIELSDLVTVTSTHPGGGGFSAVDHYVESIQYDLKPLQGDEWDVTLTLGLSPRAHFSFTPASWAVPA